MKEITVTFQPYGKRVRAPAGVTILEAARRAGIEVRSICGGKGSCGKCKVVVRRGEVEFARPEEGRLLSEEELNEGYVLACLTRCLTDCEVFVPPETRMERQRMQAEALIPRRVHVRPVVAKIFLRDPSEVSKLVGFRDVDAAYERCVGGCTVVTWEFGGASEVLEVEEGDTRDRLLGLAVDIGTTKVVAYLVDLRSGKVIATGSEYNAQLIYGEDVISRVSFALDHEDGLDLVQRAAVETINKLVGELVRKVGARPEDVYDVCVAGNTVMTYLFVKKDPSPLLKTGVEIPRESYLLRSRELGLRVNPAARVYCLPCAGRFLGGDVVGDILASGMHRSSEFSLLVDIGTNAEVVLGGEGWLLATTAPAGPAFEGWGIRFGMRAVEGAIERVRIDPETLKARYTVIGGVKPKGICGSGLIDLLAEMFRHRIIDTLGKINRRISSPYIREGEDGYEYVVVPREETSIGRDIVITERDIANLIDSKSSVCAAVSVLLKKMRLSVRDVSRVYVCGAFGRYLDLDSAVAIGLIPEFPNAEVEYIGNGSVAGAYLSLVSAEYREEAEEIAKLIAYYDLMKDADFMDEYTAGFVLPGKKELFPTWWEASRKL